MPFETKLNNCVGNGKIKGMMKLAIAMNKNDHLMTSKATFAEIAKYIPKTRKIWMPFYGDGKCAEIMRELGYKKVIHENRDFFDWEPDSWDIIIDNPPYSIKKRVLERCASFKKPFVLLLPLKTVTAKYFRMGLLGDFQMLFLDSRIHHFRNIDETEEDMLKKRKSNSNRNPIEPTWFVFNGKFLPQQLTIGN